MAYTYTGYYKKGYMIIARWIELWKFISAP